MPPQATFHFPTGFMWGTATASHQVEGNNTNNNWFAWENEPGRIINGHKAGLACDWWGGRWREDFDRAVDTYQNAHRMSVEWSRIQPAPDRWDENALDYYRQMIRGLVERGMTPMVTLHHFTDPLWLVEMGGWENDQTPQLFGVFVRKVVEALKEYVTMWIPINEPNVYTYGGWLNTAMFPPGKVDMNAGVKVMANMVRGHAIAYRIIHEIQRQARVGTAISYRAFRPARPFFMDVFMAKQSSKIFNDAFPKALMTGKLDMVAKKINIPDAVNTQDFIGINYYSGDLVTFTLNPAQQFNKREYPKDALLSDTGFIANMPEGFYDGLRWANQFEKPIIVTENGVEDADDDLRPRYIIEHIHQVWRALNANLPIKGYFHWSLVDNFEWERGWTQRFGLWGLDVETQARIRRGSVDVYAAICKENAISSEIVQKYTPAIYAKLFPEK
jgi:beta-glucosidase